jgi:hypothetical protein
MIEESQSFTKKDRVEGIRMRVGSALHVGNDAEQNPTGFSRVLGLYFFLPRQEADVLIFSLLVKNI